MFDQLIQATPAVVATKKVAAKKVATKRTTRPATAVKATPAVSTSIKYAIGQGFRPKAGNLLKAQTAAFLSLSGMAEGNAFPKATAAKIIGDRAIQYHLGNGNFEQTESGLILSLAGSFLFNEFRAVDPELTKAYEQFFKDGELSPAINVNNPLVIVKV